ncbi:MAG TPA: hypothetical protein PLQ95_09805, partial [Thiobacillus sp.]|nr:hypothetical protein [Thiobacillus sp.]
MKPESRRNKTPHPVRPEREALPPASHFATCPRGLEALLETELAAAGAQASGFRFPACGGSRCTPP